MSACGRALSDDGVIFPKAPLLNLVAGHPPLKPWNTNSGFPCSPSPFGANKAGHPGLPLYEKYGMAGCWQTLSYKDQVSNNGCLWVGGSQQQPLVPAPAATFSRVNAEILQNPHCQLPGREEAETTENPGCTFPLNGGDQARCVSAPDPYAAISHTSHAGGKLRQSWLTSAGF